MTAAALPLFRLPIALAQESVSFQRYSVDEGLSQSTATVILQDRNGFLWIGTQDGLNKFDGYSFVTYRNQPGDARSLAGNNVRALYEDRAGTLWIATVGGGLQTLDLGSPTAARPEDRSTGNSISTEVASRQSVFQRVAYSPPGNPDRPRFQVFLQDIDDAIWIGTNDGVHIVSPDGRPTERLAADDRRLAGVDVRALYLDDDQDLWVGTGEGLQRYVRTADSFETYHAPSDILGDSTTLSVSAITSGSDHVLRLITSLGVLSYDKLTNTFTPQQIPGLARTRERTALWDRSGKLWVGTGVGLFRIDAAGHLAGFRHDPGNPSSIGGDEIYSLFEDRAGVVWVGTGRGGLNKIVTSRARFTHFQHDPSDPGGLGANYITGMATDTTGAAWIGTDRGLDHYDPTSGSFSHIPPSLLSGGYVKSVYHDNTGTIWITPDSVLLRLDPATAGVRIYGPAALGLTAPAPSINGIAQSADGNLWLGLWSEALGYCLLRFEPSNGSATYVPLQTATTTLASQGVQTVVVDQADRIWVGTWSDGLWLYDAPTGRTRRFGHDPADTRSLSHPAVQSVYPDRAGNVWVGTRGGGLSVMTDPDAGFRHYREADGLPNDVVYGILEDEHNHLWISTNNGLSRFDPASETFVNYDVSDGLQSNEFNRWAYSQAADGRLFFGGINGFNVFDPEDFSDPLPTPEVALTGIRVQDQTIAFDHFASALREVQLDHNQNFFSFEFVAPQFVDPGRDRYAYLLEGFDDDWVAAGARRFANYTNVDAGTYTFRVRAANRDGVWSQQDATLRVVILPPFWETWWFLTGILGLLVAAVYAAHQYRVQTLLREQALRMGIARDLHDDVSATLGSISHFVHAIRRDLGNPIRPATQRFLHLISDSTTEAKDMVRDIIWSTSPEHDAWESVLARMRRHASDLLDSRGVTYEIEMPETVPLRTLNAFERRNLWLLFKELLANAVTHSSCRNVTIQLRAVESGITLNFADDGAGFDPASVGRRSGLNNLELRARELGGTLTLETAPGQGTKWKLLFSR